MGKLSCILTSSQAYQFHPPERSKRYAKRETNKFVLDDMNGGKCTSPKSISTSAHQLRFSWNDQSEMEDEPTATVWGHLEACGLTLDRTKQKSGAWRKGRLPSKFWKYATGTWLQLSVGLFLIPLAVRGGHFWTLLVYNALALILKEVIKLLVQKVLQSTTQAQPSWTAAGEDSCSSALKVHSKLKVGGELVYVALHWAHQGCRADQELPATVREGGVASPAGWEAAHNIDQLFVTKCSQRTELWMPEAPL